MLRPRRTLSRASARAALAVAAALICLGLAVTATTPAQRAIGLGLAALGLWQAWRETRRRPRSPGGSTPSGASIGRSSAPRS